MSEDEVSRSINRLANSITPIIAGAPDATGGFVESLTESVMGVTAALCKIADAIETAADEQSIIGPAESYMVAEYDRLVRLVNEVIDEMGPEVDSFPKAKVAQLRRKLTRGLLGGSDDQGDD